MSPDNPFLTASELPYQLPPFDRIETAHFLPAFERGVADHQAEVDAIAAHADDPTFDNTVVALERAGQLLDRLLRVFFNAVATDSTPVVQEVEAELAPKLAAHRDAILLDPRLFARVEKLHAARDTLDLDAESLWLLERYHLDFVRAGARLSPADQERLRQINTELSTLTTTFSSNLLAETNDLAVDIGTGDPVSLRLFTNQPALAELDDRELRERIHTASVVRGTRGNAWDNTEVVRQIVTLRAEQARLLGYDSHAAYVIDDTTARTVDAVAEMLAKITPAAVANAEAEGADLQELLRQATGDAAATLQPWDWSYYAERLRRERYDLDAAELRPYFELRRVLTDGVFFAAGQLYGLRFTERFDLPTYHPGVRVFEVFDEDGSAVGLFLADLYTRDTKRGGAWMSSFVSQSRLLDTKPVVLVNLNIDPPGEPDEATLLTFDEVRTLFHEFGHALHGLFSDVRYPRLSGTSVPRDFVEYPSQVNEMWALWPEVLTNYARHHLTGEALPAELVERLIAAGRFNEGYATTEYLAATLLDQAWHTLGVDDVAQIGDVERFEAAALERAGVAVPTVPPRYRTTYFSHAFSGGAYSARYYAYIWSEVLDADTVSWFEESGGLLRSNGDRFRKTLLSKGGSVDSMGAFRELRGRDPQIEPLLDRRGLTARPDDA